MFEDTLDLKPLSPWKLYYYEVVSLRRWRFVSQSYVMEKNTFETSNALEMKIGKNLNTKLLLSLKWEVIGPSEALFIVQLVLYLLWRLLPLKILETVDWTIYSQTKIFEACFLASVEHKIMVFHNFLGSVTGGGEIIVVLGALRFHFATLIGSRHPQMELLVADKCLLRHWDGRPGRYF